MDIEKKILIENVLFNAISAFFHDCDNKEKREQYIKEYTIRFCEVYDLNTVEVIEILKGIIERQKKTGFRPFPNYEKDTLDKIIFGNKKATESTSLEEK